MGIHSALASDGVDWEDQRQKELVKPSSPYSAGANGWESGSIGQFLESAAAWAEATSSTPNSRSDVSDVWRLAAMIIVAGAHTNQLLKMHDRAAEG